MIRERVQACISILEALYGVPEAGRVDPVDLLVLTILSQNTTDANSLKAFGRLKSAFPDVRAIMSASEGEVMEAIRPGGLAGIKARRIKEVLRRIQEDSGALELGFLARMDPDSAMRYLASLPGVGPKTASVVLLFGFGMPFMPVDTHVYRVSRRLGLVPMDASRDQAQRILEEITPPDKYLSLHLNLIKHGRTVCQARAPRHEECALRHLCDLYMGHKT